MERSRYGIPTDDSHQGEQRQAMVTCTPARLLRQLLARPGPVRLVGAHDALGARLAQQAGFDGVWASGLEISASQGMPDADILGMSELLAPTVAMVRAVSIPVVTDCGAGYGGVNNVIYTVQCHEAAGVAAMCFEDKIFPKRNSFLQGSQRLAPVPEFAGKIRAARSVRRDPDTVIIARTEAMIAGHGVSEALRRAEAYADAGADAILVHDNADVADRVLSFAARWSRETPIVVVPTTYYSASVDELYHAGVKMIIYANHGLRASIAAVSRTFATILREGSTAGVEGEIAPLTTVFQLQAAAEVRRNELLFGRQQPDVEAVVLATGADLPDRLLPDRLLPAPADWSPTLPETGGGFLPARQVRTLLRGGARRVSVVAGRSAGRFDDPCVEVISHAGGASAGELAALLCADPPSASVVVLAENVLVDASVVTDLIDCAGNPSEVVLLVDRREPARYLGLALLGKEAFDSLRKVSQQAWAEGRLDPAASLLAGVELLREEGVPVRLVAADSGCVASQSSLPLSERGVSPGRSDD